MDRDGETLQGPSRESTKKLDQIIQNFFSKAAVIILQSRINTTITSEKRGEARRPNKWFQIETDDIDDFREELRLWKTCGSFENRAAPLIIETYLDTSRIPPGQSLVFVDDDGKRWEVAAALPSPDTSLDTSARRSSRNSEIILERWRIDLKYNTDSDGEDFGATLPTTYKRSIGLFRSLFTSVRMMPAFKLRKSALGKSSKSTALLKCRVLSGNERRAGFDSLYVPIDDSSKEVTAEYMYGDLEVPVGRFHISTTYRIDCHFRVDDSESLLSSRLMGDNESYFRPSMPLRPTSGFGGPLAEIGSLPQRNRNKALDKAHQTYGSLSTFHGEGALSTSPFSALKALRPLGSEANSPSDLTSVGIGEPLPASSLPTRRPVSRPSMWGTDATGRRPSVSFQPFKAGSLTGSPRAGEVAESPSSQHSYRQTGGISALAQARSRNSLTAGMAASLRGGPPLIQAETPPIGSSPRPGTSRISSSFSHRKGRLSFGGASKTGEDDQGSSGKGSLSSSIAQPGSGLLAEGGNQASSASLNADGDSIADFLKELDSRKTLLSFESAQKRETAVKKTTAQLSKYHMMRNANDALTESMTTSIQLHRSSSSSSRQLASVPGMAHTTSVSSSPGKPLSPHTPHTPHTPAIPSRLSENSIVDYRAQPQRIQRRLPTGQEAVTSPNGTPAIDIPASPRIVRHSVRRSSSVNQQQPPRGLVEEEDADVAFGPARHSSSLGAAPEQAHLGPSVLFPMESGHFADEATQVRDPNAPNSGDVAQIPSSTSEIKSSASGSLTSAVPGRLRYQGNRGRATPPQSSRGSLAGSSIGRFSGVGRGDGETDEEPLVFDMSDLNREMSRRSLEEGRGGGQSGAGSMERSFEPRGVRRKGWQ